MLYRTEKELLDKASEAEGKTFLEIDKTGRLENDKAKGNLGQIVEESFFGYEVNSNKEADFSELGIELKVTPIKKNKNGTLSSKERLVLNIINYHEEVMKSFFKSSFWKKNKTILMMFYYWKPELHKADYQVIKSYLHSFPEEDLEVIKHDWEIIIKKIREGRAHELSEADTYYLGASPKGANKSSKRTQPFSKELAMQRSYSLKQSYMTTLVRKLFNKEELVRISTPDELEKKTLEQLLYDRFAPYIGKSLSQISKENNIPVNKNSKSFLPQFISSLLGIQGTRLNEIEEFEKANVEIKTVRLEPNGIPRESMSFKNVDFQEWVNESWETSWFYNYFEETKFLFVVFEYHDKESENKNRELYFKGIKLWNMPKQEIEGRLQNFWLEVKKLLKEGVKLKTIQQTNRTIVKNNLPKLSSNGLCHLRPKGQNSSDKVLLPDGQWMTKQCFWLDKYYVSNIIFPSHNNN